MHLIYRGITYNASLAHKQSAHSLSRLTRSLIYRGIAYTHRMSAGQVCLQPIAVNWRYQLPTQTYSSAPKLA